MPEEKPDPIRVLCILRDNPSAKFDAFDMKFAHEDKFKTEKKYDRHEFSSVLDRLSNNKLISFVGTHHGGFCQHKCGEPK